MPDLILLCQNCLSEFVFTLDEQQFHSQNKLTPPTLCPICRSIKKQEKLVPPKPKVIATAPSVIPTQH